MFTIAVSSSLLILLIFRFIRPLGISFKFKAALAIGFLIFSQQRLLNRLFFTGPHLPELPYGMVILQGWMISTVLILTMLVLTRDLAALALRPAYKPAKPFSVSGRLAAGLLAMAALLSMLGVWQAVRVPDTRTVEINLRDLPEELDGLRIAHLTDIHASSLFTRKWIKAVVDRTNALRPDLILLTGDIADGTTARRYSDVEPFREFQARYGVFAAAGNHEYYFGFHDWMNLYQALGLRMLLNEHQVISHRNTPLVIAGTTDKVALRFGLPPPDLKKALAGAPKEATTILMAHRPEKAAESAAEGVALQLSGHTHGGHIIGLHLIPKYVNKGFISGLYQVDGMVMYVSRGAGLWGGFPVRLGCPSDITLIILRRAAHQKKPAPLPGLASCNSFDVPRITALGKLRPSSISARIRG